MALFNFGKDKKEVGASDQVLAYLEDAQRVRLPFQLRDAKGREVEAQIQSLDEGAGRVSFQLGGPLLAEKGDRVRFVFILENLRAGGQGKLVEFRSGLAVVELPPNLELLERRKKPRARLNPREGATLTALTSLFEGVGITGVVESLSEEGARVKVERAMEVKGEKKLGIGLGLFQVGHAFMVVRIAKLPKLSSTLELAGKVAYLDGSSGLSLGLAFTDPPPEVSGALRNVVAARASALPTAIPPKSRRPKEAAPTPDEPRAKDPPPSAPREEKAAAPPAPAPPPPATPPSPPPVPDRNTALLRLKKRARILVLAMPPGVPRDLVEGHFIEEGYGKVLAAGTLTELLGHLREHTVSLVFIDGGVAELEGFELAEALQKVGEAHIPLILAAEEISSATVLNARQAGVDQLVVKPYVLDEALSGIVEAQLGL